MRRRLIMLGGWTLAVISLALSVTGAVEWVRAPRRYFGLMVSAPAGFALVNARPVGLYFALGRNAHTTALDEEILRLPPRRWGIRLEDKAIGGPDRPDFNYHFGFSAGAFDAGMSGGSMSRVRYVLIPHWFQVAATALLAVAMTALLARRRRRWRWAQSGHCRACGYDLRATPDLCPECGAVAGQSRVAAAQGP